jgi:hypothetical protein
MGEQKKMKIKYPRSSRKRRIISQWQKKKVREMKTDRSNKLADHAVSPIRPLIATISLHFKNLINNLK